VANRRLPFCNCAVRCGLAVMAEFASAVTVYIIVNTVVTIVYFTYQIAKLTMPSRLIKKSSLTEIHYCSFCHLIRNFRSFLHTSKSLLLFTPR
jgi:hypothetical protein